MPVNVDGLASDPESLTVVSLRGEIVAGADSAAAARLDILHRLYVLINLAKSRITVDRVVGRASGACVSWAVCAR